MRKLRDQFSKYMKDVTRSKKQRTQIKRDAYLTTLVRPILELTLGLTGTLGEAIIVLSNVIASIGANAGIPFGAADELLKEAYAHQTAAVERRKQAIAAEKAKEQPVAEETIEEDEDVVQG